MANRLVKVAVSMVLAAGSAGAADMSKWAASYDPETKSRFIPVELWTGAAWDGSREVRLTQADLTFGRRGEKRITGPVAWKRPGTGEAMQVYERDNRGKKQLFALSSKGDGLGRVFDSRYERDCVNEVKFPLGSWKEGETRAYEVSCNGGRMRRNLVVTIEKLDFVHEGVPHSLQFHWVVDGGRARGTNMHYIYSPGKGLVSLDEDD